MKDRTVFLDGGRLIDYQHYIDTDTLPDRAAVRRELDEAFALEADLDASLNRVRMSRDIRFGASGPSRKDEDEGLDALSDIRPMFFDEAGTTFEALPEAPAETPPVAPSAAPSEIAPSAAPAPTAAPAPSRMPATPNRRLPGMQFYRRSSVDRPMADMRIEIADPLAEALGALRPNPFPALITTLLERSRIRTYAELCEIAGISKQLFHQLMDHRSEAIPKRENVFRLAFALKAPLEYVDRLLEAKGLAFRKSVRSDVIVRYCFEFGIFNPMKVDRLLYENGCPTLFSEE